MWLINAQGYKRRGVPELHQPSPLSCKTALTTEPFGSLGLGSFQNPLGNLPDPILISPSFSISINWRGILWEPVTGAILAMGRPRSITKTSSPVFTLLRYSLRDALSFDTLAVFIESTSWLKLDDYYGQIEQACQGGRSKKARVRKNYGPLDFKFGGGPLSYGNRIGPSALEGLNEIFALAGYPPQDSIINIPSVDDAIDPHLVFDNFKNHTVVADSEFPVPFEGASQGLSVALGFCGQAGLNGPGDPVSQVLVDSGNIFALDIRVIDETVGHLRRSISGAPNPLMGKGAGAFKAPLSLFGKLSQRSVLLRLQRLPHQVPDLQR